MRKTLIRPTTLALLLGWTGGSSIASVLGYLVWGWEAGSLILFLIAASVVDLAILRRLESS